MVLWWLGAAALVGASVLIVRSLDPGELARTVRAAAGDPSGVALALGAYAAAFALRARLWTLVLPGLAFGHALAAIHVSLAGNHVLPLRLGEPLRVTSAVRRARVPVGPAAASTLALRAADLVGVLLLAAALAPELLADRLGAWRFALLGIFAALAAGGFAWLTRARRGQGRRAAVPIALAGATAAWLLEAAVIWQAARWAGIELGLAEAVAVTAVTIAAQLIAVAPGGIGTYEAAAAGSLVALGADPGAALAAALAAHALKTLYALGAGAIALVRPSPGLLGRLRLPARHGDPSPRTGSRPPRTPDQPVVLVLPAHDEEESVGSVVARAPRSVRGHPVVVVVVDDGSSDRTAERAAAAGARVVSFRPNRGLGAAVRAGLLEACKLQPSAVAFCDADGEYAPEELERLVAPILDGRADYVVGSRFAGEIRRMRPHRRLGNRLLTRALAHIARADISDGQSGYRALSPAAAAAAEIIHDFNYAQVLTLDLLAKGFAYREVPISYGFRAAGRSFVRPGSYLRHVLPAVHRELNAPR